ncbi:MAG: hypothetical protein R2764_02435 [Bacteroidales bacterium]
MTKDNNYKYNQFRKKFTSFTFEEFSISENEDGLKIVYLFNLSDVYFFSPTLTIEKGGLFANKLSADELQNLAFQIGMVELISYWKAACPQQIIIKPYSLTEEQIDWWKKLYFKGLGEFFYLNSIKTDQDSFVEMISDSSRDLVKIRQQFDDRRVLIPIGGGKDSTVTLELLKDQFNCIPFMLNPGKASLDLVEIAGYKPENIFTVKRTIHPGLLDLNKKGFLNGHTPFSALLGFIAVLVAALTGSKYIALSNESSANEPTDAESGVNHQYSKSFEFETDLRMYVEKYISGEIEYFSFLRPLSEYSIAGIFSKYPQYFRAFRSCNAGSKSNSWCGNCPKCLFAYIILSPFIDREELVSVFGKDLYDDRNLLNFFKELAGISEVKPFECVGTIDEVNLSLKEALKKHSPPLPFLLNFYSTLSGEASDNNPKFEEDGHHFLNPEFYNLLKQALSD